MMRRFVAMVSAALLVGTAACGGGGSTPTSPTATATRVIGVSGNLAFGEVAIGTSRDATMTISNTGTAALNVTGISSSGGFGSTLTASWPSGTIAAGASQTVTLRFSPTTAGAYSGSVTVNGDQTSGTNTLPVSASSISTFSGNWLGGHRVDACNGTGSLQDLACSANRGVFPVGTVFGFGANLQQSGNNVSGTVNLGGLIGSVTGSVTNGTLTLRGTATGDGFTAVITFWSTTLQGNTMGGSVNYDLTLTGVPGVAGIQGQLTSVTRQ